MVVAKVGDGSLHALALLEKGRTKVLGVDAHVRRSFLPRSTADADARRRSTSAGPSPVSRTILSRPEWPETSSSVSRGIASASASSRRTASFARPCSGAAVTLTFHASPWRPTLCARPAPGLAPCLLLQLCRCPLRGDERRAQQPLELTEPHEIGLELLDLVREIRALAPHVLEARGDLVEQPVHRGALVAEEPGARSHVPDLD